MKLFSTIIFMISFLQTKQSILDYVTDFLNIESCNDNFIWSDFSKLESNLRSKLFGQEIIIKKLVPIVQSHYTRDPKKALSICMHGWTGSGKNYATKILIDNIYRKKFDSSYVHFFNGRLHFPIDEKPHIDEYKVNIQNWIKGNVTRCSRSMFIFDEVDKIPPGVLDGIKPFLDYHEKIDSVDYRKSVFIFISNIGGGIINQRFVELWRKGYLRKDMKYQDFESHLRRSLYNTKGGFQSSSILESHLVSLYLPFLPMEETQVRQCIEAEIKRQNIKSLKKTEDIEEILNDVQFNADGISMSGCKRIADLVSAMKYSYMDEL